MLPASAGTRFIAFIAFIEFIAFVEFIELIEFIAFIYLLQLVPCDLCLPTPAFRLPTCAPVTCGLSPPEAARPPSRPALQSSLPADAVVAGNGG